MNRCAWFFHSIGFGLLAFAYFQVHRGAVVASADPLYAHLADWDAIRRALAFCWSMFTVLSATALVIGLVNWYPREEQVEDRNHGRPQPG